MTMQPRPFLTLMKKQVGFLCNCHDMFSLGQDQVFRETAIALMCGHIWRCLQLHAAVSLHISWDFAHLLATQL